MAELIDGGKHPRIEHVPQNQQVRRFAFVGKAFGDFVHANGEVGALVKEIFDGKVALQTGHAHGGGYGDHHGDEGDDGGGSSLT